MLLKDIAQLPWFTSNMHAIERSGVRSDTRVKTVLGLIAAGEYAKAVIRAEQYLFIDDQEVGDDTSRAVKAWLVHAAAFTRTVVIAMETPAVPAKGLLQRIREWFDESLKQEQVL